MTHTNPIGDLFLPQNGELSLKGEFASMFMSFIWLFHNAYY